MVVSDPSGLFPPSVDPTPMPEMSPSWFDGHLDLACMALEGRDLRVPLAKAAGPPQPPSITLPSLREGAVGHFLATLYTGLGTTGPCGYATVEDDAAHRSALEQRRLYARLADAGELRIARTRGELQAAGSGATAIILMEGADPIRTPDEAEWWFEQGARVVGLTWARGSRYAGGNAAPGPLTQAGRTLIRVLDQLGMIHDLSHLADEAAWQLLDLAYGPVVASHSNCRALALGHSQRNLPDDLIRAIAERGGVIGLNLFSLFLSPQGETRRATIDETIAHVERIVEIAGRADVVALGSDMDGGFGADRLPEGINAPRDLTRLTEALQARGWSEEHLAGFRFDNWMHFLRRSLPHEE